MTRFSISFSGESRESRKSEKFVETFTPTGGTAINDALTQALSQKKSEKRPYLVIFITDGLPTVGETNIDTILNNVHTANQSATRIFCFGLGYDVNTHLLDRITEETQAASQYVKPNEDLEIKVSDFFAKIKDPVLSQIMLKFDGVKVKDVYPQKMPDLFRGSQLIMVGRYEGDGKATLNVSGLVNEKSQQFTYPVTFTAEANRYDFIPRLWATQKVAYLLDQIRLHGSNKELIDEATKLAKRFGIVTPYTSYLILEDQKGLTDSADRLIPKEIPMVHYKRSMNKFMEMRSASRGQGAVEASKSLSAMRESPQVETLSEDTEQLGSAPSAGIGGKHADIVSQVRHVAGKTFFFNGEKWVDTETQTRKDQKKVTLDYLSDDYFRLLKEKPAIGKFLAVGESLLLSYEGVTYEIRKK